MLRGEEVTAEKVLGVEAPSRGENLEGEGVKDCLVLAGLGNPCISCSQTEKTTITQPKQGEADE